MSMTATSEDEMIPGGLIHGLQLLLVGNADKDRLTIDEYLNVNRKLLLLEKREWFYSLSPID